MATFRAAETPAADMGRLYRLGAFMLAVNPRFSCRCGHITGPTHLRLLATGTNWQLIGQIDDIARIKPSNFAQRSDRLGAGREALLAANAVTMTTFRIGTNRFYATAMRTCLRRHSIPPPSCSGPSALHQSAEYAAPCSLCAITMESTLEHRICQLCQLFV